MPIKNVNETEVVRACAMCGGEETIAISTLQLGADRSGLDPDAIYLPPCFNCGATESLHRTWDECPEKYVRTAFYQQRMAVNALAQHLRNTGKSHPSVKHLHDAEAGSPPQCHNLAELKNTGKSVPVPERVAKFEHLHPAMRPPKPPKPGDQGKDKDK